MKKLLTLVLVVLLVACGQGNTLDGTWVSPVDGTALTFKPDGTMYQTNINSKTPHPVGHASYVIKGNKIELAGADILQLRIQPDRTITSSGYGVMVKQ